MEVTQTRSLESTYPKGRTARVAAALMWMALLAFPLACDPPGPELPDADVGDAEAIDVADSVAPITCLVPCPDDGNPCTDDVCDPATGYCGLVVPDGTPCDPGVCAEAACQAGACIATPTGCDDSIACTYDHCDVEQGCQATPRGNYLTTLGLWLPHGPEYPRHIVVGLDSQIYAADQGHGSITRVDPRTGASLRLSTSPVNGWNPIGLAFGPDGYLYSGAASTVPHIKRTNVVSGETERFASVAQTGLTSAGCFLFGADGHLYICEDTADRIVRLDGATGTPLGPFVATGSGGLQSPRDARFGPDGHLYVASGSTHEVLRYDGASGAFIDVFVSAGDGGLDQPAALHFHEGAAGWRLLVVSQVSREVLRYDGVSGAFLDVILGVGDGGLSHPRGLTVTPQGELLVSDSIGHAIRRYDSDSGAPLGTLAEQAGWPAVSDVQEMLFHQGMLYVASWDSHSILRFHAESGHYLGLFVSPGDGGLVEPSGLLFSADGDLYVSSRGTGEVLRYDGQSGAFSETMASGLTEPYGLAFGPDGALYIADASPGLATVKRVDPTTAAVTDFTTPIPAELEGPRDLAFGADGLLYVASYNTVRIVRFDALSGAFVDSISTMFNTVTVYPQQFQIGPDGLLYVTKGFFGTSVFRFDPQIGQQIDRFQTDPMYVAIWPRGFTFGADGRFYVWDAIFDNIRVYAPSFAPCLPGGCAGFSRCTALGTCLYTGNPAPDGASCDDADPCTSSDACASGVCVGVSAICDDADPCTDDACDPVGGCVFVARPEASPCDDGEACTSDDTCQGGACVGISSVCDDADPCTTDSCDSAGGCLYAPRPEGSPCDDGDPCTTGDACQGGACIGASAPCDDSNPCTTDSCDAAGGCQNLAWPEGSPCDDGDACTTGDSCQGGACVSVTATCDDGEPCTTDLCDPTLGCVFSAAPEWSSCAPASCTVPGVCRQGLCIPPFSPAPDPCHSLAQVPAHQFQPMTGKVGASQTISMYDVEAMGPPTPMGTVPVTVNQPGDPASGIMKGSSPGNGPHLVATGNASLDLWLDVHVDGGILATGDPLPCPVGINVMLVWDGAAGFAGLLDPDHALEISALDAGGAVVTGPDGQPLSETFTSLPGGPPPNDVLLMAPPGLFALAQQPGCGGIATIRVRFPPSASPVPRDLPFYHVLLAYL